MYTRLYSLLPSFLYRSKPVTKIIQFPNRTLRHVPCFDGPLNCLSPSAVFPSNSGGSQFSGSTSGILVHPTSSICTAPLLSAAGPNAASIGLSQLSSMSPPPVVIACNRVDQDPNIPPTNASPVGQSRSAIGGARRGVNQDQRGPRVNTAGDIINFCQPFLGAIKKEFMPPQVENSGSNVINLLRWIRSGAQQESKSEVERTEKEREIDGVSLSAFFEFTQTLDEYQKKVVASIILHECDAIHIRLSQLQDVSSDTHHNDMVGIIQFCKQQLPEEEYEQSSAKLISLYLINYSSQFSTEHIVTIHDETKKHLVNSLFFDIKSSFFPLRLATGLDERHTDKHKLKGLEFIKRMNQEPELNSKEKDELKKEFKNTLLEFAKQQLEDAVANEPDHLKTSLQQHFVDTLTALGDKLDKELFSDQPGVSPFYLSKLNVFDLYTLQNDRTKQCLDEIEKTSLISRLNSRWWVF